MKSIKVTIAGKSYPLKVEEENVQQMERLASEIDGRFREFKQALSTQPDFTAMVMTCLSYAEEAQHSRVQELNEGEAADWVSELLNRLDNLIQETK